MVFLFDLDGTLTVSETLPIIAGHFSVEDDIESMTNDAVNGEVEFSESFTRRVGLLSHLSVTRVAELISGVGLYAGVTEFIRRHSDRCFIVSSNLDCWCAELGLRIGCEGFYSEAIVRDDAVVAIKSILCKKSIVMQFHGIGEKVAFIGDGDNDFEAMREADVAIVAAMNHSPTARLRSVADFVVADEMGLCEVLERLAEVKAEDK